MLATLTAIGFWESAQFSASGQLGPRSTLPINTAQVQRQFEHLNAAFRQIQIDPNHPKYPKPSDLKILRSDTIAALILCQEMAELHQWGSTFTENGALLVANSNFIDDDVLDFEGISLAIGQLQNAPDQASENKLFGSGVSPLLPLRTLTNGAQSFIAQYLSFFGSSTTYGSTGIATVQALHDACNLLKIGAYDGGSYSANPGTRTYVTASLVEFGGKASASFNGEIYWQVGKYEISDGPTPTPTPTPTLTPTPTPTLTSTPTPTPTPTPVPNTQKAIFGYGYNGSIYLSLTNLVNNTGVVATDTTGVGTARMDLAAAGYGTDKAIFGYGTGGGGVVSLTNLVSNTGVVATNTTGVGTARSTLAAAGYGGDKAIFGYGYTSGAVNVSLTNLVSNTGVVATDTTGVGTARHFLAASGYGSDKSIFGYGNGTGGYLSLTNLVSNTGVVSGDTSGVGTGREYLAAAGYGTDKAIFGYGSTASSLSMTNKVSNTGIVATDTTGVGTARLALAAAGYGNDKAIFGYGRDNGYFSTTNLVSNTGVVATDTTGVGTSRMGLAAAGYSLT